MAITAGILAFVAGQAMGWSEDVSQWVALGIAAPGFVVVVWMLVGVARKQFRRRETG